MILIREVQEPTRHAPLLKDIENRQSLGNRQAVIQVIVDDKMRGGEAQNALRRRRIPASVVLARFPERPVELALHEPQFLRGDLGVCHEGTVVRDERLEFSAQVAALDPVYHESAEAGAGGDSARGVDVVEIVADVFPAFDEVFVRGAACFRAMGCQWRFVC